MMTILAVLVGVLGGLLLSYGSWLMFPAAGFIVGGTLCLCWSYFVARALATNPTGK